MIYYAVAHSVLSGTSRITETTALSCSHVDAMFNLSAFPPHDSTHVNICMVVTGGRSCLGNSKSRRRKTSGLGERLHAFEEDANVNIGEIFAVAAACAIADKSELTRQS